MKTFICRFSEPESIKENFSKVFAFVICFKFKWIHSIFEYFSLFEYNLGNNNAEKSSQNKLGRLEKILWTIEKYSVSLKNFGLVIFACKWTAWKTHNVCEKWCSVICWNESNCVYKGNCYQNGSWPCKSIETSCWNWQDDTHG